MGEKKKVKKAQRVILPIVLTLDACVLAFSAIGVTQTDRVGDNTQFCIHSITSMHSLGIAVCVLASINIFWSHSTASCAARRSKFLLSFLLVFRP